MKDEMGKRDTRPSIGAFSMLAACLHKDLTLHLESLRCAECGESKSKEVLGSIKAAIESMERGIN